MSPAPAPGALGLPAINCITPKGYARLSAELERLQREARPQLVAAVGGCARAHGLGDHSAAQSQIRDLDARIEQLRARLESSLVTDPARPAMRERVAFGARVTFANERGEQKTVTLLGAEEADAASGEVSWNAPLARALAGHAVGDCVVLSKPSGEEDLEILAIDYPAAAARA